MLMLLVLAAGTATSVSPSSPSSRSSCDTIDSDCPKCPAEAPLNFQTTLWVSGLDGHLTAKVMAGQAQVKAVNPGLVLELDDWHKLHITLNCASRCRRCATVRVAMTVPILQTSAVTMPRSTRPLRAWWRVTRGAPWAFTSTRLGVTSIATAS